MEADAAPFLRAPSAICARCDDGVPEAGLACCTLCREAAERAVARAGPGVLVTFAMVEAERRGGHLTEESNLGPPQPADRPTRALSR